MKTIHRRVVLAGIAAFTISLPAHAGSLEELSAPAGEGSVMLTRYPADRTGQRPVAAAGNDIYLLRHFTFLDQQAMDLKTSTPESRAAYEEGRYEGWMRRVSYS